MKLRVYAMLGCSTTADLEAAFARTPVPSMFGDRLAVRAIKMYADGALGSRGAWLLEPYSDRPGHYGFPVTDPTVIQIAVRGCLDQRLPALRARDRRPREPRRARRDPGGARQDAERPITASASSTRSSSTRSDITRFRLNGVIPSIQPCHATSDAAMAVERLGIERVYRIGYPVQVDARGGLHPPIGTDAPVEPISPIENFYSAVVRQDAAGRLPSRSCPEQRMNRLEALLGMTEYGAYAAFCDDRRGMLAPATRPTSWSSTTTSLGVPSRLRSRRPASWRPSSGATSSTTRAAASSDVGATLVRRPPGLPSRGECVSTASTRVRVFALVARVGDRRLRSRRAAAR